LTYRVKTGTAVPILATAAILVDELWVKPLATGGWARSQCR